MPNREKFTKSSDPRSGIMHLTVTLGDRVYDGDLEAEARVDTDPAGLNQALAEQPGKFAWWATLEVLSRALAESVERELAIKHAELYAHYEAAMSSTDTDGKRARPTVDKIKSQVIRHKDYVAIQQRLASAAEQRELLTVARQTMQMRKDSLLAVASNMRAERDAHIHDQLRETRDRLRAARG